MQSISVNRDFKLTGTTFNNLKKIIQLWEKQRLKNKNHVSPGRWGHLVKRNKMSPRQRILVYIQCIVWISAVFFILGEAEIIHLIPVSGVLTLCIFGGATWAMIPRKMDKCELFCWYHIAMSTLCAIVGVLDIVNFYIEDDITHVTNSILKVLKYTILVAGAQTVMRWFKDKVNSINNGKQ